MSHQSATYLYELLPYPAQPGPIHVTVTARRPGAHEGIHLHRTTTLLPHELRERDGIPVTAPLRTLLDLAGYCPEAELERAVAEAFALRLTNRSQLLRAIDAARGRRGVARLRALVDGDRRPKRSRSAPERKLLGALRAAALSEPLTNHRIGRWEVDLYWPAQGLVVEVDGYAAHSSTRAFERDRRKDAELAEIGLTIQRFSAARVNDELDASVAWIRRALERLA